MSTRSDLDFLSDRPRYEIVYYRRAHIFTLISKPRRYFYEFPVRDEAYFSRKA